MKKKVLISVVLLFALLLAACAPAAAPVEEAAPAEEEVVEEEEAPVEEEEAAPTCQPAVCEDAAVDAVPAADVDAACAADPFGCAVIEPGQTIKVGMSAPYTGPYADFGIDAENSGLIAAADACGFAGFDFEIVMGDDEGGGEGGALVANKHVADPTIVGVAGTQFSGAAAAAAPIYDAAGVVMLSPSATNPPLTAQGWAVFNRLPFTDADQGNLFGDFAFNTLGLTKIAVLHDGEEYGKGLAELSAAAFEAQGGEVTILEGITPGEADYTPILTTIAADAPELIYFGGYNQEGAVLTNQMKTTGLEDAIFFGCDGTYGVDYINQAGDNANGTYTMVPRDPDASDALDNFKLCYEEAYGTAPLVLSPYSFYNYDAPSVIMAAVKENALLSDNGSLYVPRTAMIDAIRGLTDYQGLGGVYTCSEVGECDARGPQILIIEDGEYVSVE